MSKRCFLIALLTFCGLTLVVGPYRVIGQEETEAAKQVVVPAVMEVTLPDLSDRPLGTGLVGGVVKCEFSPTHARVEAAEASFRWHYFETRQDGGWTLVVLEKHHTAHGWRSLVRWYAYDVKTGKSGYHMWDVTTEKEVSSIKDEAGEVSWRPAKNPWKVVWEPGG